MNTMNPQHAFQHQHPYNDAWGQTAHHPQNLHHPGQQQQQHQAPHYGRLASVSNASATAGMAGGIAASEHRAAMGGGDQQISEEDRRTLDYVAQLLNQSTRETALLELSKKREQVPELALVLWHSFGMLISD
jgi:CCR4-NOT transcription complex subunit 9